MTKDGKLNNTDGFWYCDANSPYNFCPEFDIMEANKYAFRSTIHTCDDPDEHGFISDCERGGFCPLDQFNYKGQFGDKAELIDTNQPFTVNMTFNADEDKMDVLTGYTLKMTQGDNVFVLDTNDGTSYECDEGLIGKMGKNLADGMALVFSIWGGDTPMDWLTHGMCTGGCGAHTAFTKVSNIKIK